VRHHKTTAPEHDNAGFEVWRMIEGEEDVTFWGGVYLFHAADMEGHSMSTRVVLE
jgi:hypothetical protein